MKALIRFSREESSSLETSKYLSNLEKSLRFAGISCTSNLLEQADIAHFISPNEEKQINDAYLEDLRVVISVGYTEGDPKNRFFEYPKNSQPRLLSKSIRVIKQADLLLVPTQTIKDYLISDGIEVPIEIVTAGVDVEKFSSVKEDNKDTFRKYFKIRKGRPYVLAHGSCEPEGITTLNKIAKDLPTCDFVYLVDNDSLISSIILANKNHKKNSKNLCISHAIPEDVYVSGMVGATAFISLPVPYHDYLSIFEAFGSKTQVIYMDANKKHGIFENRNNVLIASNEEKAQRLIWALSNGEKKTTINAGHEFATQNSLKVMGNQLKTVYKKLINK